MESSKNIIQSIAINAILFLMTSSLMLASAFSGDIFWFWIGTLLMTVIALFNASNA